MTGRRSPPQPATVAAIERISASSPVAAGCPAGSRWATAPRGIDAADCVAATHSAWLPSATSRSMAARASRVLPTPTAPHTTIAGLPALKLARTPPSSAARPTNGHSGMSALLAPYYVARVRMGHRWGTESQDPGHWSPKRSAWDVDLVEMDRLNEVTNASGGERLDELTERAIAMAQRVDQFRSSRVCWSAGIQCPHPVPLAANAAS